MLFRCVALLLFLALVFEDIKEALTANEMRRGGGRRSAPPPRLTHIPATCDGITRFATRKARSELTQITRKYISGLVLDLRSK